MSLNRDIENLQELLWMQIYRRVMIQIYNHDASRMCIHETSHVITCCLEGLLATALDSKGRNRMLKRDSPPLSID